MVGCVVLSAIRPLTRPLEIAKFELCEIEYIFFALTPTQTNGIIHNRLHAILRRFSTEIYYGPTKMPRIKKAAQRGNHQGGGGSRGGRRGANLQPSFAPFTGADSPRRGLNNGQGQHTPVARVLETQVLTSSEQQDSHCERRLVTRSATSFSGIQING